MQQHHHAPMHAPMHGHVHGHVHGHAHAHGHAHGHGNGHARRPAHTLVYSPQCPNCMRFLDALGRTAEASNVAVVDVHEVPADQAAHLAAVPALITGDGNGTLYGTKAFEWLKQFEADVELDGFVAGQGSLGFSDFTSMQGYVTYAQGYSAFEPMPEE